MTPLKKTINNRNYTFIPKAAGPDGLEIYAEVMARIVPVVGAVLDSAIKPLFADGETRAKMQSATGLKEVIPDLLGLAAEQSTFSKVGAALGRLMGDKEFRALVLKLFASGLKVESDGAEVDLSNMPAAYFSKHLEDYIPAVYWVLRANYDGAFSGALGFLPTALPGAAEVMGRR